MSHAFLRIAAGLVLVAASRPVVLGQTVVFADDMENLGAHWSTTGLWHSEAATDPCGSLVVPFPSGVHVAYYGIPGVCDYDTGGTANAGALTLLAPVTLPATGAAAELRFWSLISTEPCYPTIDQSIVEVSTDGGAHWTEVGSGCATPKLSMIPYWHEKRFDLTPFLGSTILLRFRFDTGDGANNAYLGWMIDDVAIRLEAGHAYGSNSCPCNNGSPTCFNFSPNACLAGCLNSQRGAGELAASGTPSVSADDVVLNVTGLRIGTYALFVQGDSTSSNGVPLGDGSSFLRGNSIRLGLHAAPAGTASYPAAGEPSISVQGRIPGIAETRFYQVIYRDPAAFCTTSAYNFSNAYVIGWFP